MGALPPSEVVTITEATPSVPAGVVAVTVVALATVTLVAAIPPIVTPVAPVKLKPVIVTDWPPAVGPGLGLTLATLGGDPTVTGSP